jgi:hypothetical protein
MRPNLTYQNHFDGAPVSAAFQLSQRALERHGGDPVPQSSPLLKSGKTKPATLYVFTPPPSRLPPLTS